MLLRSQRIIRGLSAHAILLDKKSKVYLDEFELVQCRRSHVTILLPVAKVNGLQIPWTQRNRCEAWVSRDTIRFFLGLVAFVHHLQRTVPLHRTSSDLTVITFLVFTFSITFFIAVILSTNEEKN